MDELKSRLISAIEAIPKLSKKTLIAFFAVAVALVFVLSTLLDGSQTEAIPATSTNAVEAASDSAQLSGSDVDQLEMEIFAHVVGEVVSPGIYSLDYGARVVELVLAAGGFTEDAEQSSVNLARTLEDGEQVIVLAKGQLELPASSSAVGGVALINLNRALAAELESLPGVGPALAGRIIAWREANGGFKSKDDLLSVSGIGEKVFAGLKDLVSL